MAYTFSFHGYFCRYFMRSLLVCALAVLAIDTALAQRFNITPANPILLGEPITISLTGLPPGKDVTISSERVMREPGDDKSILHRAEATFTVAADGTLDLASAKPKRGSYARADVRGLFWSMLPVAGAIDANRVLMEVRLRADAADTADAANKAPGDKALAETALSFVQQLAEVKTEPVAKFPGAQFATVRDPADTQRKRPAIILLGGSEGGTYVTRAAGAVASRGFAVLALPYYSPTDWQTGRAELASLPAAFMDIPVERLNEARAWLQTRSDVDATRIAIHGTSKGAEFALLAGVHLPWVTSIVAIVPSDVVWEGWGDDTAKAGTRSSFALNGKALPFVPYADFAEEFAGYRTGEAVRVRRPQDKGRAANPAAAVAARIPVERIKAPVMVIAGQEDQVWNSAMMAHNIAERRAQAKLDTVSLIYTDAGHYLSGTGYNPTTQYDAGPSKAGGTPEGNARAQADAWPKTIAFLKRTLGVK